MTRHYVSASSRGTPLGARRFLAAAYRASMAMIFGRIAARRLGALASRQKFVPNPCVCCLPATICYQSSHLQTVGRVGRSEPMGEHLTSTRTGGFSHPRDEAERVFRHMDATQPDAGMILCPRCMSGFATISPVATSRSSRRAKSGVISPPRPHQSSISARAAIALTGG